MVISLLIDSKNNIWIGTEDAGLSVYDGNKITYFTTKQGLPSNHIKDIIEDTKGNIWIATTNGFSIYNNKTITTYKQQKESKHKAILSIFEDNEGSIWLATNGGGVLKCTNGEDNKDALEFVRYTENEGLTNNYVLTITQDYKDNMWFGTYGGGVSKLDNETFTNYTVNNGLGNNIILSIVEDNNHNMWFGTYGNGITQFDGVSFSNFTASDGLSNDYIRVLFDDNEGNLWIGTDGGGVSSFIINSFNHFTTKQGLSNDLVLSIIQDNKNQMWFGTFEGGVLIYDEDKSDDRKSSFTNITTNHGLGHNIISSIIQDDENNYWFGTFGGGISMLDNEKLQSGELKFTTYSTPQGLPNDIIRCILQDNEGTIWIGTEGGISKYDGEKWTTISKKNGLKSNKITSLYEDKNNNIWVGTMDGGVSCIKNDSIITYTTKHGLADNTIWTILQDANDNIWFGTNGAGLSVFNGSSFQNFNTNNGLSNNYVYSLILDSNNAIWAGTTRGLNKIIAKTDNNNYNPKIGYNVKIINYGKMDGLISLDFFTNSALLDNKNRIWWGTGDALTLLDLNTYSSDNYIPKLKINQLLINNTKFNPNQIEPEDYLLSDINYTSIKPFTHLPNNLSLPYNLNNLSFTFSAIDWSSPSQIYYQYKLLGYENNWSLPTKNTVADYRNIPHGKYKFLVRTIGKSNIWSKATEYSFIIHPPLWLTWWAIAIYTLMFILFIWLFIRWRLATVTTQNYELENIVLDRTKDLNTALKLAKEATLAKSQFIATVSHEIRTPLNAIIGLSNLAINSSPNKKLEDYLSKIDRSANTLLNIINDVLDFSKIEAGKMRLEHANFDLEIVLNSVIVLNSQSACKKNIELVVNINPDVPTLLIGDSLRIGQVITNLVNNAIKFTQKGEVVVNINIEGVSNSNEIILLVSVSDTGIGINEKQIPFLFDEFNQADNSITRNYGGSGLGLAISQRIVNLMNGRIWAESKIGIGSTFYFNCKLNIQSPENNLLIKIPDELKEFNILLCDNNLETRKSISSIIKSHSLNIDTVATGNDAINQLQNKPYELLLISQKLANKSGIEIIKLITCNSKILPTKNILIINANENKHSYKTDNIKIDEYLSKPAIPSVVIEKILKVFGMSTGTSKYMSGNTPQLITPKTVVNCNALLAEDNEINQQVVSELLQNIGINVDVVENGELALQKANTNSYDIILMDLHMPVMDGYTASKNIRKNKITTPIIAITADVFDTIKDKCEIAGINDIVTKPISPNLLYNTILNWLDTNKQKALKPIINKNHNEHSVFNISIPNLDTTTAINRFGGNINLYKKMLIKFADANTNTCKKINELYKKGEKYQAQLIIHSLKGESGNVGATKIANISQNLENTIINYNNNAFADEFNTLEKNLNELILSINNAKLQDVTDANDNKHQASELIKNLITYLQTNNPKAFDILDELANTEVDKSKLNDINKLVDTGNVKEAINLLNKL